MSASTTLFVLYVVMAAQHKEVVGLEHYFIWGPALIGVSLVVLPQDKMVLLFVEFWRGVINKFTK